MLRCTVTAAFRGELDETYTRSRPLQAKGALSLLFLLLLARCITAAQGAAGAMDGSVATIQVEFV